MKPTGKSAGKIASFLQILVLETKTKRFEHTGMISQEKKDRMTKTKKPQTYITKIILKSFKYIMLRTS
jgi:uncharacterized protein (UPF0218 family)